jgi:hypothetical protein
MGAMIGLRGHECQQFFASATDFQSGAVSFTRVGDCNQAVPAHQAIPMPLDEDLRDLQTVQPTTHAWHAAKVCATVTKRERLVLTDWRMQKW